MKRQLLIICLFFLTKITFAQTPCINGEADGYPCDNVTLLGHLSIADLEGNITLSNNEGNDIWGWTDSLTGKEYAIMGLTNSTAFVDVSVPTAPTLLGNLANRNSSSSIWSDIKTYNNYAYVVSEASGHGIQVFDLNKLRNVTNPPVTFTEDGFVTFPGGNAHNIILNAETGYVYTCGTAAYAAGGLVFFNLENPTAPVAEGYFEQDGYTHDAVCFIYKGMDKEHIGKEICIGFNEDTYTIVDVTNKTDPQQLSRNPYANSAYAHQGWITDDQRYLVLNDELDERNRGHKTKTYLFDIADLDAPTFIDTFVNVTTSIDHNLFVKGNYIYQSNYTTGLRVLEADSVAQGILNEAAFFDIYPQSDAASFNGAWGNYPYFKSGNIIVSGINEGLFVLRPELPHFVMEQGFPSVVELCKGNSTRIPIDLTTYYGFSDTAVELAVATLLDSITLAFEQSILHPDSVAHLVVSSSLAAPLGKAHVLVHAKGNAPSSKEQLAIGLDVEDCPTLQLDLKVFLEGSYAVQLNRMDGKFQALEVLAAQEPFSATTAATLQNFGAKLKLDATAPAAVEDWVLVELKSDPDTTAAARAALLQPDGTLVDTNGNHPIQFPNVAEGDYYICITHRNHGSVMTSEAVNLTY